MPESDSDTTRTTFEEEAHGISLLDLSLSSSFHVFYTMQEHITLFETEAELLAKTKDFKATFGDVLNTSKMHLKKLAFFQILDAFVDKIFGGIRTCDGIGTFGLIEYMTETRDYFKAYNKSGVGTKSPSAIEDRITRIDALMNIHQDGPVVPMTKAVVSQLSTRFSSPYSVYLLDLVDRHACNFDLTRTYEKMENPNTFDGRAYGTIDIGGCPGGAFLSNPPAICWPCRDLRAAKAAKKTDETLVKKFAARRRTRLQSIDVWLARKGPEMACRKRRLPDNKKFIFLPLAFAPRKVVLSSPLQDDGRHSHRRWRVRRPLSDALPSKPRKKRAADIVHTLHFQLEYLAYRDTLDKDQRFIGPSLFDKHCYNYAARPGLSVEQMYVFESAPKSARAVKYVRRHNKHVFSQDIY